MRCPTCRKAIPDGSAKHPDCGWGYEEPKSPASDEPRISHAEARVAYERHKSMVDQVLRGPSVRGRRHWERILERHARGEKFPSITLQYAREALSFNADAEPAVATVQREPGGDDA